LLFTTTKCVSFSPAANIPEPEPESEPEDLTPSSIPLALDDGDSCILHGNHKEVEDRRTTKGRRGDERKKINGEKKSGSG